MKQGTKVTQLTKKVGQAARTGKVRAMHGDSVEVEWEDGHRSIVDKESLYEVHAEQKK